MRKIGLKIQDIEIGKEVYYYEYADKYTNTKSQKCVITSEPYEICDTLCCKINISPSVVALDNLSFEDIPEQHLSSKKIVAKSRYAMWNEADGTYDGISFGDFLRYKMYKTED